MISIILTVLKIIGFFLLALLLLLLLVVFVALFVPLRYSARLTRTEEEFSGEVRLTWMLHLISVCFCLDIKDRKPVMQLRIFGVSPADVKKFFHKGKKKRKQKGKQNKAKKDGNTKAGKSKPENLKSDGNTVKVQKTNRDTDSELKPDSSSDSAPKPHSCAVPTQKSDSDMAPAQKPDDHIQKVQKSDSKAALSGKRDEVRQEMPRSGSGLNDDVSTPLGSTQSPRLLQKMRAVWNKVRQIPSRVRQIVRKIRLFLKKPAGFLKKLESLYRIAQKNEFSVLCEELWDMVKALLKHFRVRKGSGYLQFGTGDASATGELTGLLYLLLPAACGDIQIQPQFTEKIFWMDVKIRGHIRLVHLVRTAWGVFRNKRLRGLIGDLRTRA